MPPVASFDNGSNGRFMYAVVPCQLPNGSLLRRKPPSDVPYLRCCEFGAGVCLSAGNGVGIAVCPMTLACTAPPPHPHILRVVLGCPGVEVAGITAGWIVAVVAQKHACRHGATSKHPCHAMGILLTALPPEASIAIPADSPRPGPAGAKVGTMGGDRAVLVHACPEAGGGVGPHENSSIKPAAPCHVCAGRMCAGAWR